MAALGLGVLFGISLSPLGLTLRAIRDNPLRVEAVGIDVRLAQWMAFVLAGLVAGAGGVVYVFQKGSAFPDYLFVVKSIEPLIMILLGGWAHSWARWWAPRSSRFWTRWSPRRSTTGAPSWEGSSPAWWCCSPAVSWAGAETKGKPREPAGPGPVAARRPRSAPDRRERPGGPRGVPAHIARRRLPTASARWGPGPASSQVVVGQGSGVKPPGPGTGGGPVLELREVRKAFGGVRAVDGVTLAVEPGEIRALIGPNGAGKTSLFNLVTGHIRPDAGAILYRGRPLQGQAPHRIWRQGLARTFQVPAVFPYLIAVENVQVALASAAGRALSLRGRARDLLRGPAEALLGRVGLGGWPGRPPGRWRTGTRRSWSWPLSWPVTRSSSSSTSRLPGWPRRTARP